MSLYNLFFVLSFCFIYVNTSEYVPVLTWSVDEGKVDTNYSPLEKVSSLQFYDYVKEAISHKHNSVVVAFTEENLSVEDFSWKDGNNKIAFPHLEKLAGSSAYFGYFTSVHAPLKGLKRLVKDGFELKNIHLGKDKIESLKLQKKDKILLIVKLDDAETEEDRPSLLRRHDRTISEVYQHLVDEGFSVLALYTGHHSSWIEVETKTAAHKSRRLLQNEEADDDTYTFWNATNGDNTTMLYSSGIPTLTVGTEPPLELRNTTTKPPTVDYRNDFLRLNINIKSESQGLWFDFSLVNGYWKLSKVEYQNGTTKTDLLPNITIEAPMRFSYHCSKNVSFSSADKSIILDIPSIQVQVFINKSNTDKFGDAYDCVWFFTTAIWSGLFVTAICGLILMWGLSMILSIRTMDQFDDPKGKTITITATD